MEIEVNKVAIQRVYRKLKLPKGADNNTSKKPGPDSKTIKIEEFEYSFKDYNKGKKTLSYRCTNRHPICKTYVYIPESNFDSKMELKNPEKVVGLTFSCDHSSKCLELYQKIIIEEEAPPQAVNCLQSDFKVLQNFIYQNPLLEPKTIQSEMIMKGQKFKKYQIVKTIQEVRSELFPRDDEVVFSQAFCCAEDSTDPIYNLYQMQGKVPYIGKKKKNAPVSQKFVILANKTMLKQLSISSQWFLDATFKVAPKGYYQMLNFIVYIPHLNLFYPACFVFMTTKTQDLYSIVFESVKTIALIHNYSLKPKTIMCDFEKGMRNAIVKSFVEAKLVGCYFHFTKCLFTKMNKLGLKKEKFKNKALALIYYFQILSHCEKNKRKDLLEEIKDIYKKENSKFDKLIKYFETYWLNNSFLDNLFEALEEDEELAFIRSNNPCEVFHHYLGTFLFFLILIPRRFY